ncbi:MULTISPECIES: ABC transporter permease/substrate binding protein [unclassified Streptomyces]|uniref:ABC transporter permease/substrate binding protein n=1 Tax=unclassified Streptomyces TaxID=2593676 RepID=UPI002DDAFC2F|nr:MULTISPECIES: ABC transporter permease/substrate binding protein [unclassified Streptomyces]WSA96193.1 ABC transporter permease/substrate binding protein [Streptomyces sp. NBC_01795]WSB80606.1 ABC transporter permease/substrate binding protein [Streptomyces sp. NBC_01775]WSS11184.1 ABC transporter permease/substrate binding protein [Streptomyces sp. NBC_01186]WSS39894.1 ABC transporter permease/substrate binding protein [Streptomyces sp. NBC_01187]
MPEFHPGDWVETAVDWLQTHLAWLFDFINTVLTGLYDGINGVLAGGEPLLLGAIFAVIAFWLRGLLAGVVAFAGFALIDSFGLWGEAMSTLSLVLAAAVITIVIAVPAGIWAARNKAVSTTLRPVLDVMQTMPAFVYLIPGVMFFSVGTTPGLLATIIFSMPPGVRMTELGIRQVDSELVEAAEAFGTSPKHTLTRVQLPLALPTIMAGINQVIMLALSMVVIAGMAGAPGLGERVYAAVTQVQVGLGVESGVAVVILAMYLDRMTGALNARVSPLGRRAAAKATAVMGRMRFTRYKPGTAVALCGVVVLALVAGGLNIAGTSADDEAGGSTNVGKGKQLNMGYIPWDEGIATSYLWKEVLEQRGYKPNLTQLDAGPLYTSLAQGKTDFQTDAWLPTTHAQYWDKYGSKMEKLGDWYGPTSLELSVPKYVKGVDSLADLKGQGKKFKGKIIGIESSAGEMKILKEKVLKDYGLEGEYKVVSSSTSSMLAELKRSIQKKEPVAVTLWSPHWAYNAYDLTKLQDPKGSFGKGEKIHNVARKGFAKDEPTVASWLKNFKMSEKQLTSLEDKIQGAGKGREQDTVKDWLKDHPGFADKMAPVPGGKQKKGKDAGKPVNIGYFPWDEAIATTYLWENILEDRGYKPNVKQLDPGPLYTAMSQGRMDVQTDSWLPTTHEQYWRKYKSKLTDVGKWYGPTSLELSVPKYVKGVDSLADLKGRSKEFGGKITGIESSAGEMKVLKKVLKDYGLDKEYKVVSSSTSSMLSEVDRSVKQKKPVLATTWSPHWVYNKYPMKKLKDPKGSWGKGDDIHVTAKKDFKKDFPELHGWLKNFKMSEKDLASLEAAIQKGGKGKEKESARKWMDSRPGLVDKLAPVK